MITFNTPGLYPTLMFHRSSGSHLAIGAAMLNHVFSVHDDYVELYEAGMVSGGWRTRFNRGSQSTGDLPCGIVVMYVEGLTYINGDEGAWDERVEREPACWALAQDSEGNRVYMWSPFSFASRIAHDGIYDLADAYTIAQGKELPRRLPDDRNWLCRRRNWMRIERKREVPGRIKTILHRTVAAVEDTLTRNFGQGKSFFELPQSQKLVRR